MPSGLATWSAQIPWLGKDSHKDDPYWDFFINTPAADLANTVTEMIRNAPEGNVFPTRTELHTPEITSSHVKGMAEYFGAELIGHRQTGSQRRIPTGYPFAVICAVHADYDPRTVARNRRPGAGAEWLVHQLRSELVDQGVGFSRQAAPDPDAEKLAARAGLGTLNKEGRLVTPQFGANVHVANVIRTDLPLAPTASCAMQISNFKFHMDRSLNDFEI